MIHATGVKHLDWTKHYRLAWAGQKRVRRRVYADTRAPAIFTRFKFIYSLLFDWLDFDDLSRLKRLCKQSRQWIHLDRDSAALAHMCSGCHRIRKVPCGPHNTYSWYYSFAPPAYMMGGSILALLADGRKEKNRTRQDRRLLKLGDRATRYQQNRKVAQREPRNCKPHMHAKNCR
jgi:hypothetical protein